MGSGASGWVWVLTAVGLLWVFGFNMAVVLRRPHEPGLRENWLWLVNTVGVTIAFALALLIVQGAAAVVDFTSEYLQQYVFSVDEVFLTAATMVAYKAPRAYQQKLVALALTLALGIRTVMLLAGWVLTNRWVWLAFLTAAIYAFRALSALGGEHEFTERLHLRWLRRLPFVAPQFDGSRMTVRANGRRKISPLAIAVIAVATSDMLFAPEPGNPYHQFTATALALLLVLPLLFLLAGTPLGEQLRLGRLLALVLVLMCARMVLAGTAAIHLTHVGRFRLPSAFADSVWASLLLAIIVTAAVFRFALYARERRAQERQDSTRDTEPRTVRVRRVLSRLRGRRRRRREDGFLTALPLATSIEAAVELDSMSRTGVPAMRLRLRDGRHLRASDDGDGQLVACFVESPGPAETFAVVNPARWPPRAGDRLVLEGFTRSWNLSCRRMRVEHTTLPALSQRRRERGGYMIGGANARVLVRLPFPATYPSYGGEDPAERTFILVGEPGNPPRSVALQIAAGRRRRFLLRVAGDEPAADVHADGRTASQPGTRFTALYGEVDCGHGWRGPPRSVVLPQSPRPK
jgi:tellurite resistance protein TerC